MIRMKEKVLPHKYFASRIRKDSGYSYFHNDLWAKAFIFV